MFLDSAVLNKAPRKGMGIDDLRALVVGLPAARVNGAGAVREKVALLNV